MANLIVVHTKSKSNPSAKPYETVVDDTGRFGCTCRGWTVLKSGKPRYCNHCEGIQKRYNLTVTTNGDYVYATNLGNLKTHTPAAAPAPPARPSKKAKPSAVFGGIKIIDMDDDDDTIIESSVAVVAAPLAPPATTGFVEPMLASLMPNLPDQRVETVLATLVNYPATEWALEEKFDGHRIIVAVENGAVTAWSRPKVGKDAIVRNVGDPGWPRHIADEFATFPNGTYDGEVYVPGGVSTDVTDLAKQDKLVFATFDLVRLLGNDTTGLTYDERRELLEKAFATVGGDRVRLADSVKPTAAYVRGIFKRGGEGAILKRRAAKYQVGQRSADWIKIKGLEVVVMEITGYKRGKNGPRSVIRLINPADHTPTTVAAMGGGKALLDDITQNGDKYIGRRALIEYQIRTTDGKYRHPRWDRWDD